MDTLRCKLESPGRFLIGTELVSVRGGMQERSAVKARQFASQLVECPDIDWISITDNAGGNPQLAPSALGKPILYAGKEVVIHLTCKDLNRNGLESEAWLLHSEGFQNILAMTGDYPIAGAGGAAKPVFDIDSVALIALLSQMNEGLDKRFGRTKFLIGAVTTNFKLREGEVIPQYKKLEAKVRSGAHFIINQIGFDARKMHELCLYMGAKGMAGVPLVGNVYMLNGRVAELFHQGRIPGVVVTAPLRDLCLEKARSPDKGAAFFQEFAAKQIAIYRGLGCRGAYLGGVHDFATISKILAIERSFAPGDWKQFVREFSYGRPDEFYFYGRNAETGLSDPALAGGPFTPARPGLAYRISKQVHASMFTPGKPLARWGRHVCAASDDPSQGPPVLRAIEHAGKALMFRCKDCGDCSLPEIAYLCPESQCAKNQRNGPCGGTRDGRCEVDGYGDCIWLRAYERLKSDRADDSMLAHAPVVQNQALRGTSSWANYWLGKDHTGRRNPTPPPASPCPP